jgi:CHAT domain-containing protein
MHHLHNSSVIHFACHATQDFENPLNSGLILSDGCLDMSQIMRIPVDDNIYMMKNSMKLAFLSARETAKGDAKTPDEAMNLAASLLFAGFGGVISTMW